MGYRKIKVLDSEKEFRTDLDKKLKGFFGNRYRAKLSKFCGIDKKKIKAYFNCRLFMNEIGDFAKRFIENRAK